MVLRGAVMLLALAGCDQVFDFDLPTEDGGADPAADAATATTCIPPALVEPFDEMMLCGTWGYAGGVNRTMLQGGGSLTITPQINLAGNGNCVSAALVPFGDAGMFVEVSRVLPQDVSYTFLKLAWAGGARSARIVLQFNELRLERDEVAVSAVVFGLDTMRWWKLRPDDDELIGEYSADGRTWTELGRFVESVPAFVEIDLHAGLFAGLHDPGAAVFEGLNACPPDAAP